MRPSTLSLTYDAASPPNRTELRFWNERMVPRLISRDVTWAQFEPFKLRLAAATFYTPDFAAVTGDGQLECWEIKTTWRGRRHAGKAGFQEDARVKIKVAATVFPFLRFRVAQHDARDQFEPWKIEEIAAHVGQPR